jgi:pimeloyl-ACP methyl ester carboxylesterase
MRAQRLGVPAAVGIVSAGVALALGASTASALTASTGSPSQPLTSTLALRSAGLSGDGGAVTLGYCGNAPIDQANAAVRRIIVIVHGDSRQVCDAAKAATTSASLAGVGSSTLVVAPYFIIADDAGAKTATNAYWSDSGWKMGSSSLASPLPRTATISSFAAMDQVLAQLSVTQRFPNADKIVVAGHSAGGQFVNRYAATTTLDPSLGIRRTYVVANPSSYLYLSNQRPVNGTLQTLTSSQVSACSSYNRYKYGLDRLNAYAGASSSTTIKARYAATDVTYLLGTADTLQDSALDTTCSGKLQGLNRWERGNAYFKSLGATLGSTVNGKQRLLPVPGVGHEGSKMFTSTQGQWALFS